MIQKILKRSMSSYVPRAEAQLRTAVIENGWHQFCF
jgi:hypothetical protein